jgi:hypothetical protein
VSIHTDLLDNKIPYESLEHDGVTVTIDMPKATRAQKKLARDLCLARGLTLVLEPDWTGFTADAMSSGVGLFAKLMTTINYNAYASFLVQLTVIHDESRLLLHFNQCRTGLPIDLTAQQVTGVNNLLEKHGFTIRV